MNRKIVVAITAKVYGIPVETVTSRDKHRKTVECRYAACLMMREFTRKSSLKQIASAIGLTDHSTIIHGLAKGATWLKTVPAFAERVELIRKAIIEWRPDAPKLIAQRVLPPKPVTVAENIKPPPVDAFRPNYSEKHFASQQRYTTQFTDEWWRNNDRRFRVGLARAHPERFAIREAAE